MSDLEQKTITSMEVAEMVEKTHANLLKDIRTYDKKMKKLKVCWVSAGVSSFVAGYLANCDEWIYIDIADQREDSLRFIKDCEKILHQIDLLNQKKNSLLEESVNKNFKLVTWRLFKFQKNGEVLNDCTPMIDGKDFESCSNGALKVLAKLDIIDGLQRYYNQFYPVFADDFALVTSETESRIDMDCQLVTLVADSRSKVLLIGGCNNGKA